MADTENPFSSDSFQFILFGIGSLIYILVLEMGMLFVTRPQFPVPTFQINCASINSFNVSNSHLTAYWDFSITAKTAASSALNCEDVKASILLNNSVVSPTRVQNLSFRHTNRRWDCGDEKNFHVNLASSNVPINQSVNAKEIKDGSLTFSFSFSYLGTINEDVLWFVKKSEIVQHVVILCENLEVVFNDNDPYIRGSFPFTCTHIRHHH